MLLGLRQDQQKLTAVQIDQDPSTHPLSGHLLHLLNWGLWTGPQEISRAAQAAGSNPFNKTIGLAGTFALAISE